MLIQPVKFSDIPSEIIQQIEGSHHEPKPQPTFGLKVNTKLYDYGFNNAKQVDIIELKNGKKLTIIDYIEKGKTVNKLFSLKDKCNKWIKSKLLFFDEKGKKYYTMNSKADK